MPENLVGVSSRNSDPLGISDMRNPKSAREVVNILGGIPAVCKLTRANVKAVYYWTGTAHAFPSRTFCKMEEVLKKKNWKAPPHLWNMLGYENDNEDAA